MAGLALSFCHQERERPLRPDSASAHQALQALHEDRAGTILERPALQMTPSSVPWVSWSQFRLGTFRTEPNAGNSISCMNPEAQEDPVPRSSPSPDPTPVTCQCPLAPPGPPLVPFGHQSHPCSPRSVVLAAPHPGARETPPSAPRCPLPGACDPSPVPCLAYSAPRRSGLGSGR